MCERNDESRLFKLKIGTKFCSKKKASLNTFPLVLEQEVMFGQCTGLKVLFFGKQFIVSQWTECEYKMIFNKGTAFSLESDETGLFKTLHYDQQFVLEQGSKIEIPAGTILVSNDKQANSISITLNNRVELEVVS